eukprot:2983834-Pleurochrysis_carterae.AAC.2
MYTRARAHIGTAESGLTGYGKSAWRRRSRTMEICWSEKPCCFESRSRSVEMEVGVYSWSFDLIFWMSWSLERNHGLILVSSYTLCTESPRAKAHASAKIRRSDGLASSSSMACEGVKGKAEG